MDRPLVSVVVPIYNTEKYLDRCILSIVEQTYNKLEIILVDDGSYDKCSALCDKWALRDERIIAIHKKNAGLGMARNTGIDHSTGKYIFFWDSDDYVDKTIVEKCVENAEENNSDVVMYGRYDVYEDGNIEAQHINVAQHLFVNDEIKNILLPSIFTYDFGFGVSAWGKMFNLTVLRETNIKFCSEREMISEDAYFTLQLFNEISVASIIEENLYFYYQRSRSLSHTFRKDRQIKNNHFLCACIDYANKKALPVQVIDHIVARYHMYTVSALKQVVGSDLDTKTKKAELRKIYKDKCLKENIYREVLCVERTAVACFMVLIKLRLYFLCDILLKLKANNR